ncbi:MAG: hypothetical protein GY895_21920, partial [Phycisphaera sp.]|nr:hypothetical protein [Phycisphaera sp.]
MPPRPAVSKAELDQRRQAILDGLVTTKDRNTLALVERMHARQQEDPEATMDFLILSGGGANGAFGAGFLLGWATVPAGPDALPTFDGVSGVSTGAFIAPFAYIGTDESRTRIDQFFRNPKPDWARLREPLSFYPENASLMELSGIERDLQTILDLDFARCRPIHRACRELQLIQRASLGDAQRRITCRHRQPPTVLRAYQPRGEDLPAAHRLLGLTSAHQRGGQGLGLDAL